MVYEFAILASIRFLLYAAEGAAPDKYVGSLRSGHVWDGMLALLPTPSVNVASHFGSCKITEKRRMNTTLLLWLFIVWLKLTSPHWEIWIIFSRTI